MTDALKIVLAQLNPIVGDVEGNTELILKARAEAGDADLVVCPELSVSGYPPEDLVLRRSYTAACRKAVDRLAEATADGGPGLLIGAPWADDQSPGRRPFNAAIMLDGGAITGVARKVCLPNYGPFDEPRTFKQGPAPAPIAFRGTRLGVMICEDMWYPEPAQTLAEQGAEILVVPHGSPFRTAVSQERFYHAHARSKETGLPLAFINQCGGQDELVFDGGCFVVDAGQVYGQLPLFEQGALPVAFLRDNDRLVPQPTAAEPWSTGERVIYEALVTGTRDYVQKSGFQSAVIGLSGGIDSALVAAIAVDALGPENVHCVRLPSRYTSAGSMTDAEACAQALGVRLDTVDIEPAFQASQTMLAHVFEGRDPDVTEENLQSRIRGTIVMAMSNKLGSMMLTTGNKSEMSVGYATLYGDMNGGYNPLKDVYKTTVFALSRWRNEDKPSFALGPHGEVIPEVIITKPPSAELREDQKDEDSLPPYDELDKVLFGLTEEDVGVDEMIRRGHDAALVHRVRRLLFTAEYKRRQSAPGPKVSTRYFGRDRRYPIVNRFGDR
ncbi:MAG: NAD+ synthase [Pseudomonadota bacterium]